eukprot:scaffold106642_cov32-Tisochrysis_lutea.AAC.3
MASCRAFLAVGGACGQQLHPPRLLQRNGIPTGLGGSSYYEEAPTVRDVIEHVGALSLCGGVNVVQRHARCSKHEAPGHELRLHAFWPLGAGIGEENEWDTVASISSALTSCSRKCEEGLGGVINADSTSDLSTSTFKLPNASVGEFLLPLATRLMFESLDICVCGRLESSGMGRFTEDKTSSGDEIVLLKLQEVEVELDRCPNGVSHLFV